ncbi:MAG: aldo/keto reductase [Actinomycetia bacterium]|nr:aldo/keto reductase [Actinomycetes bacterium]
METRTIGSLEVSTVGLGCNNFGARIDAARAAEVVHAALDAGVTLFDTADIYGATKSETFLGAALGSRRGEAVIATKFGGPIDEERKGASGAYVKRAAEDSLKRLGTDHIDLYQLHFPDQSVPIEETLGALDELVREGKVREIGSSNFSAALIEEADGVSRERGFARFVSVQNEYSLLNRTPERHALTACEKFGVAFIPYFPLASGVLTGKYQRGEVPPPQTRLANAPQERVERALSDRNFDVVEALEQWASDHGHPLLDLAMSWLLHRPVVASVIAGATRPEQVRANAEAASWKLTDAEVAEVDEITAPLMRKD